MNFLNIWHTVTLLLMLCIPLVCVRERHIDPPPKKLAQNPGKSGDDLILPEGFMTSHDSLRYSF